MKIQRPIGTYDLTPEDTAIWQHIEHTIRQIFTQYNFGEIRTPVFEYTELFQRGVGESSDIVSKEMYTFDDRGGRSLTLRPEGTASVVRAYIENGLAQKSPGITKLWYFMPMFRYERKQKGRFRQHVQYGCEVLGSPGPEVDLELLVLLNQLYTELGLSELELKINSVGCATCRPIHREKLVEALADHLDEFCDDCKRRYQVNPMRMFDCKNQRCQELLENAPMLRDHLCEECEPHFARLREGLDSFKIPYTVEPKLVRGLDYYTRTAFEMLYAPLGSQGVLVGGGRYDGLVEELGGQPTPGIGFGAGMERLILILKETQKEIRPEKGVDVFLVAMGDRPIKESANLLRIMRKAGLVCDRDYSGKSFRKQMQMADKLGSRFICVIGEDEMDKGVLQVKNLQTGEQREIPWTDTLEEIIQSVSSR
ncbi:histidine--tRNA ligase [bacterium]|nr:histidine--tRNA ligase [bacterium]